MIKYEEVSKFGVVACDVCKKQALYKDTPDWRTLIDAIKEDGWSIKKQGDRWMHTCLACMQRFVNRGKKNGN